MSGQYASYWNAFLCFKIFVNVSITFSCQLMSIHTTKVTEFSIEFERLPAQEVCIPACTEADTSPPPREQND